MARSKTKSEEIEAKVEDPFERAALVQEQTSNDGRFSTYERVKVPGGELILQHRGAPKAG